MTSGARAYSALTTLIGLVLTVRWLGAEGRGIVVVVTTWVTIFANLGSLSLWQVSVHRGARAQSREWLGPFLGALFIIAASTTLLGWVIAGSLYGFAANELFEGIPLLALALGFLALPFLMGEFFSNSLLSVVGRLGFHNFNQVASRTIGLIALVVGIKVLGLGIYGFLLSFLLTEMILAGAAFSVLFREASGRFAVGFNELKSLVRDGLKMHLHTIGVLLYSSSDILLLHYFHGAAAAGVYQFASAIFFALMLVAHSTVFALQARIAALPLDKFWWEHRLILVLGVGVMTLVAAVMWVLAPWIAVTLGNQEFKEAGTALRILLLALPVSTFVWLMGVQWLARGYFLRLGFMFFLMGVTNFALNWYLVPRYGASGAAFATVLMWVAVPLIPSLMLAFKAHRDARHGRSGEQRPPVVDWLPGTDGP